MREDFDMDFERRKSEMQEPNRERFRKLTDASIRGFRLEQRRPARRKAGRKPKVNVPIGGPEWSRPERAK